MWICILFLIGSVICIILVWSVSADSLQCVNVMTLGIIFLVIFRITNKLCLHFIKI